MHEVITEGKISPLAQKIAVMGKTTAKNMMAREAIEGYVALLENILKFSSEVVSPKDVQEVPPKLREEWSWHPFEVFLDKSLDDRTARSYGFLAKFERQWNHTPGEAMKFGVVNDDSFVYEIWEEERYLQMMNSKKRREDEEVSISDGGS